MEDVLTRYGYIYKITNKINGKIYIGKRIGSSFDEKYWGSGTRLKVAIKEFGQENFIREIIEWCSTKDILCERERYWIKTLNSRNPDIGYNIKRGGDGDNKVNPDALCHNGGIIISVQIPRDFYDKLKENAKEECTSVSAIIRKMIIQKIRSEEVNK